MPGPSGSPPGGQGMHQFNGPPPGGQHMMGGGIQERIPVPMPPEAQAMYNPMPVPEEELSPGAGEFTRHHHLGVQDFFCFRRHDPAKVIKLINNKKSLYLQFRGSKVTIPLQRRISAHTSRENLSFQSVK